MKKRVARRLPTQISMLAGIFFSQILVSAAPPTLESNLMSRPIAELVRRASVLGDPTRGARVFYRQGLGCVQCHYAENGGMPLGPELSKLSERSNYQHVIESILNPGGIVADGYKAEKILLDSGQIFHGMVRKQTVDSLMILVPGEEGIRTISLQEVEARVPANSMMPMGLINQLENEKEFFDLVSYVVELGKAGPETAESLKPDEAVTKSPPLPAYEKDLDHRGMIASWDKKSFNNGRRIYESLCVNCHGTHEEAGSLPNALRFASGEFKNGADPYSMYRTITHGYKMMLPQRQLVPKQKYDVIHYIREAYLRTHNKTQYKPIDERYLASLPAGNLRGPEPIRNEPWREMDYGPFLISTYEIVGPDTLPRPVITAEERLRASREGRPPAEVWADNTNFAYKGIGIRLDEGGGGVAAGSHWLAFDHDTMRIAGAWSGKGFIDWRGILFNGNHVVTPRTVGDLHFGSLPGPGWANPETGSFKDPRMLGKDGRAYGPLPRSWARYRGIYKSGHRVVIAYSVGDADVLEAHSVDLTANGNLEQTVWNRTFNIGKSTHDLSLRVSPNHLEVSLIGDEHAIESGEGFHVLSIAANQTPTRFRLRIFNPEFSRPLNESDSKFFGQTDSTQVEDLHVHTLGGPPQWNQQQVTEPVRGNETGPFAVDTLTRPTANPWKSRLRMSGLDFFEDGKALVACCCDGDVWMVKGIGELGEQITWQRIASGLFHPLGIKMVDGRIFVTCRDQIVVLNDLNGDGETDFYECFNNDHQVTDHFHEFAMGLQADADGNLYYAKSARHARDSLVPHHGTLIRVSADGSDSKILANGFRAANGVCLNPDGSFFVTDQEGHWNPMNRINRVIEGGFYGNMYSYGAPADSSDDAMDPPLCWPNKPFDRSPSELLWVESDAWGPLNGSLLNLSYGYGKIFVVPHERVGQNWQGGMCRLPLDVFPTGVMRARFHPVNGQMYACGMHAWGSDQAENPGGLYRVRYTGKPTHLPVQLAATTNGVVITFTEPIDAQSASDPKNYLVDTWGLKRSANYGSERYDEASLRVTHATLASDRRSVILEIPEIRPTWCMEISYKLKDTQGESFLGTIQNTVHQLGEASRSSER